jgi:MFS family permease
MKLKGGFVPVRRQGFRLLVGGQVASNLGDAFYAIALPWYVLANRGGAILLGTVLAAYGVPRTVLLLVGGHASDRWKPWTVMMGAEAVRAVGVGALAIGAVSGPPKAVLLVPVALVLGAGEGMFLPGSMAIIPSLLPADELQAGNSVSSSLTQVAALIGPAAGGAVVALVGPSLAFAVDAVSFVASATTLAGIRAGRRPQTTDAPASEAQLPPELAPPAGAIETPDVELAPALAPTVTPITLWGMLKSERPLQVIFLVVLAANLASGGLGEVALPALTHGPFHSSSAAYGALLAVMAGGGLVGTLLSGRIPSSSRPAVLASIVFLAESAVIAAVPYTGSVLAAAPLLAAFGLANGFGNVIILTVFQRWAPPAALGRLMGLVMLGALGTFPLSVVVAGLVVHRFGPIPFFPAAGALIALSLLAALTQREWRDLGSTHGFTTPAQVEAGDAVPIPSISTAGASQAPPTRTKEDA